MERWRVEGTRRARLGPIEEVRDAVWSGALLWRTRCPDEVNAEHFLYRSHRWLALPTPPYLASAYHTARLDDAVWLFMEPPRGVVLSKVDLPAGPQPRLLLGCQLAYALAVVHEAGFVHGDVHPDACFIRGDRLELGNFPLAPPGPVDRSLALHAAPERWAAPAYTAAADVYALGVVLHQILLGAPPFGTSGQARSRWLAHGERSLRTVGRLVSALRGRPRLAIDGLDDAELRLLGSEEALAPDDELRLLRAFHERVRPLPPETLSTELPDGLSSLLMGCLARSPEARPTARQVADGLATALTPALRSRIVHDPSVESRNNQALAYFELGERERGRRLLVEAHAAHPDAVLPWVNLRLLELSDDPSALLDIRDRYHAELRPRFGNRVARMPVLEEFVALLDHDILRLDGPIRSVCFDRSGQRCGVAGHFPVGVRLWRFGSGTPSAALFGGPTWPCDHVTLTGEPEWALVQSASRVARVGVVDGAVEWARRFADPVVAVAVARRGAVAVGLRDRVVLLQAHDAAVVGWFGPFDDEEPLSCLDIDVLGHQVAWAVGHEVVLAADQSAELRLSFAEPVCVVRFAPDGDQLLVGGARGGLWHVPLATRQVVDLPRHDCAVTAVAMSPDLKVVVSGDERGWLQRWRVGAGGDRVGRHPDGITSLAMDHRGTVLAGDASGLVRRWHLDRAPRPLRFATARDARLARGEPSDPGSRSVHLPEEGLAQGLTIGIRSHRTEGSRTFAHPIHALSILSDRLVVGEGAAVHVLPLGLAEDDLDTARLVHEGQVLAVAGHAAGWAVAVASLPGEGSAPPQEGARLVLLSDPTVAYVIGPGGLTIGRERSADAVIEDAHVSRRHCTIRREGGRYVARDEGSANGVFVDGYRIDEAELHHGSILGIGRHELAFHIFDDDDDTDTETTAGLLLLGERESGAIASVLTWDASDWEGPGSLDPVGPSVQVWDIRDGHRLRRLDHPAPVRVLDYSFDGSQLISGADDGVVRVFSTRSGRLLTTHLPGPDDGGVRALASGGIRRVVAVAYDGGAVRLLPVDTAGDPVCHLADHQGAAEAVCFSRHGRRVLTGGQDGRARLYRARDGACLVNLEAHRGPISAVGFGPDGRTLVTGGHDGRVRLWSTQGGKELLSLDLGDDPVTALALDEEGVCLVAGTAGGRVLVWRISCLWSFFDEVLDLARSMLQAPGSFTSITWDTPPELRDFDFWLDLWRDVRRCASRPDLSDVQRQAVKEAHHGVAARLVAAMGPDTDLWPELLGEVALVDLQLSHELAERLGLETDDLVDDSSGSL